MEKQTRRSHGKKALMLLMSMTLATTCVVGSTYAKYATSETGGDYARIAKFGVKITANGQSFQNNYDANSSEKESREVVKSVLSTDNVIAPGTRGDMIAMAVSGQPEVSIKVAFTGQFAIANWEVEDKGQKVYYCPLTITVGGTDISGTSFDNADEFQNAVNNAIAVYSGEYDVKLFENDSVDKVVQVPSVSWRWDFEGEQINDTYDTFLANRACEKPEEGKENDKVATVTLIIATVIEQID